MEASFSVVEMCWNITSSSFLLPFSPGTTVSLLFANQTEEDILVRDMLEAELLAHPDRLKIWYTVDRPRASGWRCVSLSVYLR